MKGLRTFIGILMALAFFGSLILLILADPIWKWGTGVIALCFGAAALGKAAYLRPSTLRGRFHVILGTGALIFAAAISGGIMATSSDLVFWLHYISRIVFIISVGLMFLGLVKQGYFLSAFEWVQVLLIFAILTVTGLWFFHSFYGGATSLMRTLVYLSLFLLFITIAVVRVISS